MSYQNFVLSNLCKTIAAISGAYDQNILFSCKVNITVTFEKCSSTEEEIKIYVIAQFKWISSDIQIAYFKNQNLMTKAYVFKCDLKWDSFDIFNIR